MDMQNMEGQGAERPQDQQGSATEQVRGCEVGRQVVAGGMHTGITRAYPELQSSVALLVAWLLLRVPSPTPLTALLNHALLPIDCHSVPHPLSLQLCSRRW